MKCADPVHTFLGCKMQKKASKRFKREKRREKISNRIQFFSYIVVLFLTIFLKDIGYALMPYIFILPQKKRARKHFPHFPVFSYRKIWSFRITWEKHLASDTEAIGKAFFPKLIRCRERCHRLSHIVIVFHKQNQQKCSSCSNIVYVCVCVCSFLASVI